MGSIARPHPFARAFFRAFLRLTVDTPFFAETYANPHEDSGKVQQLVEMGFSQKQAEDALEAAGGDLNAAVSSLLA